MLPQPAGLNAPPPKQRQRADASSPRGLPAGSAASALIQLPTGSSEAACSFCCQQAGRQLVPFLHLVLGRARARVMLSLGLGPDRIGQMQQSGSLQDKGRVPALTELRPRGRGRPSVALGAGAERAVQRGEERRGQFHPGAHRQPRLRGQSHGAGNTRPTASRATVGEEAALAPRPMPFDVPLSPHPAPPAPVVHSLPAGISPSIIPLLLCGSPRAGHWGTRTSKTQCLPSRGLLQGDVGASPLRSLLHLTDAGCSPPVLTLPGKELAKSALEQA